jgi:hypothetical protein
MAQVRSYKQLIILLEDIQRRHPDIHTFKEGESSDFGEDGSITYPALKVNIVPDESSMPRNDYAEYPSIILAVNLQMLDQLMPAEDNRVDTRSDMIRLMQDVINELTSHPYYQRSRITILNDINFEKYYRISDDNNTGVGVTLHFQLTNDNSWCGLPFEDIAGFSANGPISTGYSQSTTFATIAYVDSEIADAISGLSTDNFYTTGGTLVGTSIVFDRTDTLDAYEVQLSGLTSGITATGAYLNLSGGTVTGDTNFTTNVTVTGITTSGTFKVNTFNPTNPQIYADSDTNTGIMFDGPDIISIHTGGFQRLLINSSGQITNGSQLAGTGWETYLSGDTRLDLLSATTLSATTIWAYNDPWTIELMDLQVVDFFAPYSLQIDSVTNILNSPSITLFDDDVAYSFGATIASGSKITVSASTASVITLNSVRL